MSKGCILNKYINVLYNTGYIVTGKNKKKKIKFPPKTLAKQYYFLYKPSRSRALVLHVTVLHVTVLHTE